MITHSRESGKVTTHGDPTPPATCWPDARQRLLLRACLHGPEEARRAFGAWRPRVDLMHQDYGSNGLMALLGRNLAAAGIPCAEAELLRGNWRYHWVSNTRRLRVLAGLLTAFREAGIGVLVLKGAGLLARYYPDLGTRPMADIDLLVRPGDALSAIHLLRGLAYRPLFEDVESKIARIPGCNFYRGEAEEIDLHWHAAHDACYPGADDPLWDGAETVRTAGLEFRILAPADQLVHCCAHGMRYNPVPPLRWLADAWKILGHPDHPVDPERAEAEARRRAEVLPLARTCRFLLRELGMPDPTGAATRLAALRADRFEWVEYWFRTRPPSRMPQYIPHWLAFRRMKRGGHPDCHGLDFPEYYARLRGRTRREAQILLRKKTTAHLLRRLRGLPEPAVSGPALSTPQTPT